MFDYVLFASFLFYTLIVTKSESLGINAFVASLLVALPPFLLALFIRYLLWSTPGALEFELIAPSHLVTLGLQFVVGIGIFYKLEKTGNSYPSWLGWAAIGGITLFLIIPYFVGMYVP